MPSISIVVPAYNEEARLPRAVSALKGYLDSLAQGAEVLIVDNGSHDRTGEIADSAAAADQRFRVVHLTRAGKGLAVRTGVLASYGDLVVFCDADFSMPVEEIDLLCASVRGGADVAIGSREVVGSKRIGEPWRRHLMGRVFNGLVRVLAVPGLGDTQCGFKAFRRAAALNLFRRQIIDGWAFDVEVLFLARRAQYVIAEVPITWRYDPSSRVNPVRDTISMIREILTIRINSVIGVYN